MGRREALRRITALRNKVASSFIARMTHEAELKEIYRIKQLKKACATLIAAVWRGFSRRLREWRRKERERIRNEAATCLQRKYRKMLEVKRARIKLLEMMRKLSNPFKDITNISTLVDDCFKASDVLYNPRKPLCGVGLATFCHRLGIYEDVYKELTLHHVADTNMLFKCSDHKLQSFGIKEEIKGDRHFGVFQAEKIRHTIAVLAKTIHVDAKDRTDEEKRLHREFELLALDPKKKSLQIRRIFEEAYGER